MSGILILIVLLPVVAGVTLLLLGRRADRAAPFVSIGVAAGILVAAILVALLRPTVVLGFVSATGATFGVGGLTAVLLPTIAAITLLILVFAVAEKTRPAGRFHGLMLVFVAAVIVTVTSTTLPSLLAGWEIMGATSYALIGFHWQKPRTMPAGFVAFTVTRTADLGLYVAAGAAIAGGIGWKLTDLADAPAPWVHVIAAGILVAGLGKAAQLPFSFWLSRAMEGPSAVSALLHSAAMVAMGAYLLLRLAPLLQITGWAGPAAAWIGASTAIVLGIIALAQKDLKQLLAASTAAQLGFVILAAGVGATAGGTAQLIGHAATKALLFLVAGAWLTATGTKQLDALRGVGRRWLVLGGVFLFGAFSLAGLPPFALWWTKDAVLAGALANSPALYAAGLIGVALSAAYSAKMIAAVWAKPQATERARTEEHWWDSEGEGTRAIASAALVPMVVLAAAALILGVLAIPAVSAPFRSVLGASSQPESSLAELVASAVIAGVTVILVFRRGGRPFRAGLAWFGLERAAAVVIVSPILRVAEVLSRFDERLDRSVDGSARVLSAIAGGANALDRALDRSVDRVATGAIALGRIARKAQTGNIADYYAAAAVITVGAVLFLIVVR
jgi:NADH-quinone oxidoreductase subunit L